MTDTNITAEITEEKISNQCTDVIYPQVTGLPDRAIEGRINSLIKDTVTRQIPPEGCDVYREIYGRYRVGVNRNGILSIILSVYTIRQHAANGLDVQKAITVNLNTGKVYQLHELFKNTSDYRIVISRMIQEQIEERELPLLKEFTGITDYEEYYLTENNLVIYFQEITYFPHSAGIQEFPIPYSQIRNLVRSDSPIGLLLQDP